MPAVLAVNPGGVETLELHEFADSRPAAGQMLITVAAAELN